MNRGLTRGSRFNARHNRFAPRPAVSIGLGDGTAAGGAAGVAYPGVVGLHHVDDAPLGEALRADGVAGPRIEVIAAVGLELEALGEGLRSAGVNREEGQQ